MTRKICRCRFYTCRTTTNFCTEAQAGIDSCSGNGLEGLFGKYETILFTNFTVQGYSRLCYRLYDRYVDNPLKLLARHEFLIHNDNQELKNFYTLGNNVIYYYISIQGFDAICLKRIWSVLFINHYIKKQSAVCSPFVLDWAYSVRLRFI